MGPAGVRVGMTPRHAGAPELSYVPRSQVPFPHTNLSRFVSDHDHPNRPNCLVHSCPTPTNTTNTVPCLAVLMHRVMLAR